LKRSVSPYFVIKKIRSWMVVKSVKELMSSWWHHHVNYIFIFFFPHISRIKLIELNMNIYWFFYMISTFSYSPSQAGFSPPFTNPTISCNLFPLELRADFCRDFISLIRWWVKNFRLEKCFERFPLVSVSVSHKKERVCRNMVFFNMTSDSLVLF